ncbi:MAG: sporulation protein YqfD [Clostridia bacterium]|nr:sporulation protein YqfD [Clostridia bacterium]
MKILPYCFGYVQIEVRGACPEKWINIAIRRGIQLWDLTRSGNDAFRLCLPLRSYRKNTRSICKKVGCRTRVLQRKGFPFFVRRFKYRKALAISILLACALVGLLSSMVWSVELVPGEGVTRENLLAAEKILGQTGVRPGVFLQTVHTREVASAILQDQKDLSWVLVRRKGTKIYVEMEGGVQTAPEVPSNAPCDLAAPKDFELVKCTVFRGTPLYKVGEIVHRGQVVVSGLEQGLRASAEVEGRTWYTVRVPVQEAVEQIEKTGRSQTRSAFFLFGLKIPLPSKTWLPWCKKDFGANCTKTTEVKYWSFPNGTRLPLGVTYTKEIETKVALRELDGGEALAYARIQGMHLLDEKVPDTAEILSTASSVKRLENGTQVYEITAECLERINMKIVDKL